VKYSPRLSDGNFGGGNDILFDRLGESVTFKQPQHILPKISAADVPPNFGGCKRDDGLAHDWKQLRPL